MNKNLFFFSLVCYSILGAVWIKQNFRSDIVSKILIAWKWDLSIFVLAEKQPKDWMRFTPPP